MDRIIVYPGSIPQDTDILNTNRNTMIGLGYLAQMLAGTSTLVSGLACEPTSPASLTVTVGDGSILSLETVDSTAYGSLPADSYPLVKIGINAGAATSFPLTPPTTSGDSINYLIEATFSETDVNPLVLPYYNASNPSQPYSGPSGSGTSQNTLRQQVVELQLKAGVAAPAGTQTTPAVDSGYVGLWVVTVNYGQTAITSADIAEYPGAPFMDFFAPDTSTQIANVISAAGLTPDRTNTGQLLEAIPLLGRYSFDATSPPATPIALAVGEKCTITLNGATSIASSIATVEGVYRVTWVISGVNSTNSDLNLAPNDTTYAGAFAHFQTGASDLTINAFGSATSGPGFTAFTNAPWSTNPNVALSESNFGLNNFIFDLFDGPSAYDTVNDTGPSILEATISTYTTGKMIAWRGGVYGTGSVGFCRWNDTTTPWTSLGTFSENDGSLVAMQGTMIIERLA